MDNRQRDEMILEQNHPPGIQKWYCPTGGHCLLVILAPRFMTVIRKAGNSSALPTLGNFKQSRSGQIITLDKAWQVVPETLLDESRPVF